MPSTAPAWNQRWSSSATVSGDPANGVRFGLETASIVCRSVRPRLDASSAIRLALV